MSDARQCHGDADRLLIVGADGMLGSKLAFEIGRQGACVWETTRQAATVSGNRLYLDMAKDINNLVLPFDRSGAAVLCAARTSISECQNDPSATRRINVENTVSLAKRLVDAGIFVVFLSSNTVFDGSSAFAGAGNRTNPQHEYGRQKADAEAQLLALGNSVAVIRFSKIIGPEMPLLTGWRANLEAGKAIRPFSDAMMSPVSAAFALTVICRVLSQKRAGVTHASADNEISYENAARYIAANMSADCSLIQPISWKDVDVPRFPDHTTLDATELKLLDLEPPAPTHALDQFKSLNP